MFYAICCYRICDIEQNVFFILIACEIIDLPSLVLSSSFLVSSCFSLSSLNSLRISSLRVVLSIFIWFDTSVFTISFKTLTNLSVPSSCPAVKLTINKQIKQTLIDSMLADGIQITQLIYSSKLRCECLTVMYL